MLFSSFNPKLRSSLECNFRICDHKAYVEEASIELVPEKITEMPSLEFLTQGKLHTHVITHGHVQPTPK